MAGEESNNPCCMAEDYNDGCHDVDIRVEHEGRTYCIFHAPTECQEKLERWSNNLVYARIDQAKETGKSCQLIGTIFPIDISFSQYNKENPLPGIEFCDATFSGEADFNCTNFSGHAGFSVVIFSCDADFSNAIFSGNTYFYGTVFKKDADFWLATFSSKSDFRYANFSGDVDFMDATFSNDTIFWFATFSNKAVFQGTTFIGKVGFAESSFTGNEVNFRYTRFEQRAHFKGVSLKNGSFDSCTAVESCTFQSCDMRRLSLLGAPIEDFRFISCIWPRSKGRYVIYDSRRTKFRAEKDQPAKTTGFFPLDHQDESEILDEPLPARCQIEEIFRRLKAVAQKEHDDLAASDWHYDEKEMQLRRLKEESSLKNLRWDWGWFGSLFLFWVTFAYKIVSGFGEAPVVACIILLTLVVLPTPLLSYVWPGLPSPFPGGVEHYLPLMKKIPDGNAWWLSFWMVLWQLLVTIQAALLGFALRNKLRR